MNKALSIIIKIYQKTLSPDQGFLKYWRAQKTCKFYPTCSEYTKQALQKHPTPKAIYLSIKRILRCNPFSSGGVDEP